MRRLRGFILIVLTTALALTTVAQTNKSSDQSQRAQPKATDEDEILREAAALVRFGLRGSEAEGAARIGMERLLAKQADSKAAPLLRVLLNAMREQQATTELKIAMFYLNERGNKRAAELRLQGITTRHPNYARLDEVFFQLSVLQYEAGRRADAETTLEKLVTQFKHSPRRREAYATLAGLRAGK